MNRDYKKAVAEIKKWGVEVIVCDEIWYKFEAPFTSGLGCDPKKRQIFVTPKKREEDDNTGSEMIHELGHVLIGIEKIDEVDDGILAFEYHTNRKIKLKHWEYAMRNYMIDEGGRTSWEDAKPHERRKVVRQSAVAARARGVLNARNRPTYVRKKGV